MQHGQSLLVIVASKPSVVGSLTNASRDLAFADFLIYSHLYRFRVESEARSSVWIDYGDHADEEKAATTVAEFFEKLLLNPGSLQMFD